MTFARGDVVLARFPHTGGGRGKRRPVVIVQADSYNSRVHHFVVAEITGNLAAAKDPTSLLIDVATPDGKASGLDKNSIVGCLFLATMARNRIGKQIGKLPPSMLQRLNDCLKTALELA
jgi:mRNA interferase MazF